MESASSTCGVLFLQHPEVELLDSCPRKINNRNPTDESAEFLFGWLRSSKSFLRFSTKSVRADWCQLFL
jgi:hypothetical protein